MIRNRFAALRRWIESQSTAGRLAVLVGAVVVFVVAQQIAAVSNAAENGSAAVEAVSGIVALVLAIIAIYATYAVVRSFLGGGSQTDPSTES